MHYSKLTQFSTFEGIAHGFGKYPVQGLHVRPRHAAPAAAQVEEKVLRVLHSSHYEILGRFGRFATQVPSRGILLMILNCISDGLCVLPGTVHVHGSGTDGADSELAGSILDSIHRHAGL